ncbi:MAG: hypothetical protein HFI05_02010 [Lachnospiraceae bacterium]|jgi:hypothetical protein|nr:hypothetical protein [Lachnospiraceae bacterium]
MMNSEIALLNKIREKFLEERTKQEIQIAQWAEKLYKVDPFILKDIELPDEISLYAFMPELYKDNPDPRIYEQEFAAWKELEKKVNAIADKYNEEAKRCLLEYQQLNSNVQY